MLRLFLDCLDITEPQADGWTVHGKLKRYMHKEQSPAHQTAINWLFRSTADEPFVTFGSYSIWSALHSAVRSFLLQEKIYCVVENTLSEAPLDPTKRLSAGHVASLSAWMALRASNRDLVQLVIEGGKFCQIRRFDWVEDGITEMQFIKALPLLYAACASKMLSSIEIARELIGLELEGCIERGGWSSAQFVEFLASMVCDGASGSTDHSASHYACDFCGECYGDQGYGLIQPSRIQIAECVEKGHQLDCDCAHLSQYQETFTPYSNWISPEENDVERIDEFLDAKEELPIRSIDHSEEISTDPFLEAARTLYRAQARSWIGTYAPTDNVCGTRFLHNEQFFYEEEDEIDEFPPMPEGYNTFRVDVRECTVDAP